MNEEIEIEKIDKLTLNGATIQTINIPIDIDKEAIERFIKLVNQEVSKTEIQNGVVINKLSEIIKLLQKGKSLK